MIELETFIPAPPKQVWEKLTSESHMRAWWHEGIALELRKGGKFLEPWVDDDGVKHTTLGTVTALEDGVRLQMNWQDAAWPKPTRVDFVLIPSIEGTTLLIQHSGWGAFEDQKLRQKKVDEHQAGWQALADRFREYCIKD